ncbi:hypothetical protein AAZX31_17G102600 [Glycine max]|uniref:Secreted protein n=2 Tax=Glycine subgen. Soja TaxID=1462606 RepID=K7MKZ9_SOYBN|nr:hypothetical protein JHK86_047036 [Glycine max]KAG4932839.1 hypothetical protein JHK87_046841 [Glycine soja]KAG4942963.1 hypothetical protein JHK85_047609 [Glycine max]KAG5097291.1 hypothetical protein JHK82_047145 [Glycine max]KAG5102078.1 hypothetical protein JHK84_047047 [Glycine max]
MLIHLLRLLGLHTTTTAHPAHRMLIQLLRLLGLHTTIPAHPNQAFINTMAHPGHRMLIQLLRLLGHRDLPLQGLHTTNTTVADVMHMELMNNDPTYI